MYLFIYLFIYIFISFYFHIPIYTYLFPISCGNPVFAHIKTHCCCELNISGIFHLLFQLRKFDDRHALLLHLWTLTQTLLVDVN